MGLEQFGVVPRLAVAVAVLLACGLAIFTPPRAPAFGAALAAAAQDASAVEASLGLDRPTRRLIQQGLRNEGFDPGAPDGLFGPRTRDAIRRWQESRGASPTGHLDGEQAEMLSASGAPPASGPESVEPPPTPAAVGTAAPSDPAPEAATVLAAGEPGRPVQAGTDGEDDDRQAAQATGSARQLPPEIVVDRLLVRVERLVADEAYGAAHDVIDEINALQQAHDLALEDERSHVESSSDSPTVVAIAPTPRVTAGVSIETRHGSVHDLPSIFGSRPESTRLTPTRWFV